MKKAILAAASLVLSACAITTEVQPVPADLEIREVAIEHNDRIHMAGFEPELEDVLGQLGFSVVTFEGKAPEEADCVLRYTANFKWDMSIYLEYFKADVLSNEPPSDGETRILSDTQSTLGSVIYDARRGGANPNKFLKNTTKIRPLLAELFWRSEESEPIPD